MKWFIYVVKDNYMNFYGRARRTEYWMFVLINMLIGAVLGILSWALGTFGIVLANIYSLALLLPGLALSVRRLHDINKSWPWIFINFVPLVGTIWYIILMCTEGVSGDNQYGPDPKANDYVA